MKDEVKFKERMAMLCELFDKQMSKLLTDLYWIILEPFTDEQCETAFKEVIYSCKFFPKPADFIEVLRGKKENRATEAWLKVSDAVSRVGNYLSVKFNDPIIHSVVNAMGDWPKLCSSMVIKEERWIQKDFERFYEVISSHEGEHPKHLPGTHEIENYAKGYRDYKPIIIEIGFEEKKQIAAM